MKKKVMTFSAIIVIIAVIFITGFFGCALIVAIYILNKKVLINTYKGEESVFLKDYLNDLMAPVFVLLISSIVLRLAGYELNKFWMVMLIGLFAAIVWEFLIPLINQNSVTDPKDLICYMIGALVYYGIKNIKIVKKRSTMENRKR